MKEEKSLALAIGLNLFFPGFGYIYMGRPILGIAAFVLVVAVVATNFLIAPMVWLTMNIIMALDMLILQKKRQAQMRKPCVRCAETIQKAASVCHFCGATQDTVVSSATGKAD